MDAALEPAGIHVDVSDKQLGFRHKEEESCKAVLRQLISVGTAELHNLALCKAKRLWITERAEELGKSAVFAHLVDTDRIGDCVFHSDIRAQILEIRVQVTSEDLLGLGDSDTALGRGEIDGSEVSQVAWGRFSNHRLSQRFRDT